LRALWRRSDDKTYSLELHDAVLEQIRSEFFEPYFPSFQYCRLIKKMDRAEVKKPTPRLSPERCAQFTAELETGDIPEVSSPNDLAHHLGVSRRFLEDQVKAGRLRVRKISPRAVRFFRGDVLAWLNSVSS